MNDRTSISGPVTVEADGPARVAYDLATRIANHEPADKQKDRDYWLRLFAQCNRLVIAPDEIESVVKWPSHGK